MSSSVIVKLPNSCEKSYSSGSVLQKLFLLRESGRWGDSVENMLLLSGAREAAIVAAVAVAAATRRNRQLRR